MEQEGNKDILGWHWLGEGHGCNHPQWGRSDWLGELLRSIPDALGLSRLSAPRVHLHDGVAVGMVLLAESHFALHLQLEAKIAYADLFSCAPFCDDILTKLLAEGLGSQPMAGKLLLRRIDGVSLGVMDDVPKAASSASL